MNMSNFSSSKFDPFESRQSAWPDLVCLTRLMKESCYVHWHDWPPRWHPSCHVDEVSPECLMRLMHKSCHLTWRNSVTPIELAWLVRIRGRRHLFLLLPPPFFPPPLFGCGDSLDDSWAFSSIRSPWCPKLPPWVGIPILLGMYVIFTVSFGCILKFPFGWTHVIRFQN
jgi:hypothetical protein